MSNPNDPAFPTIDELGAVCADGNTKGFKAYYFPGLTKREFFAAMALQGFVSTPCGVSKDVASLSVKYADALLSELEKNETPRT